MNFIITLLIGFLSSLIASILGFLFWDKSQYPFKSLRIKGTSWEGSYLSSEGEKVSETIIVEKQF
jgi:hypothetical protein